MQVERSPLLQQDFEVEKTPSVTSGQRKDELSTTTVYLLVMVAMVVGAGFAVVGQSTFPASTSSLRSGQFLTPVHNVYMSLNGVLCVYFIFQLHSISRQTLRVSLVAQTKIV
mmetsp:Transcript_13461/g.13524  ORF Transcript_13461/g.13524 Transcript_13461/m.13524 type:complete len:112 (+) Transcript_13461:110-445(+)